MSNRNEDSDDDEPRLSAHALAALQEFYAEQQLKEEQVSSEESQNAGIDENWKLSQFWYSEETASILAKEVISISNGGRIACLCAPTLYKQLLREHQEGAKQAVLLEYDSRFKVYGEQFVFYDYNQPLDLPNSLESHSFDVVFADPPYLSEECLSKVAQTVEYLAKGKVILCTGQIMQELAMKILSLKPCKFKPEHARNLMNDFSCFVNYETQLDYM